VTALPVAGGDQPVDDPTPPAQSYRPVRLGQSDQQLRPCLRQAASGCNGLDGWMQSRRVVGCDLTESLHRRSVEVGAEHGERLDRELVVLTRRCGG
jgi:hypothetical protein